MTILLHTNVIIDHLRGYPPAIAFIASLPQRPSASVATLTELFAGAGSRAEERRIHAHPNWVRFPDIDAALAESAGRLLKHFKPSHGLDDLDAIIAATAEHHGLNLATRNVKHFPMFKKLKAAY